MVISLESPIKNDIILIKLTLIIINWFLVNEHWSIGLIGNFERLRNQYFVERPPAAIHASIRRGIDAIKISQYSGSIFIIRAD